MADARPLIRVPPFPRARVPQFTSAAPAGVPTDGTNDPHELVSLIAHERVGGAYWGSQPELPPDYVLVAVKEPEVRDRLTRELPAGRPFFCADSAEMYDPWYLAERASQVIVDADDELALVAALAGRPVRCIGGGPFAELGSRDAVNEAVASRVLQFNYANPFTGEPMTARQAVELSAFWRKLIDSNRSIAGAFGIAAWKRDTIEALLWAGSETAVFRWSADTISDGDRVVVWRSRTSPEAIAALHRRGAELIEVEDGFIRSAGLGADCVPPLSIVVDRLGIYFDARRPSDLERILEEGAFPAETLERARRLRAAIVSRGISKYESGAVRGARRSAKRSVLVPGQVEDDRAVLEGGAGLASNLELLRRVRTQLPDAHIAYKPHPDVEAGHRKGAIADGDALTFADEVVRQGSISQLIDAVDEVHVNTSLAGFEALLRFKPVTTYGVPFYAGWGLTTDLGPVPKRRTARRSLDELVAAALILYPRYLDPQTGLPCPPEIVVERLAEGHGARGSRTLVWLRRLQGRLRRQLANVANG